jgi:homoserine kinase type II
MLDLGAYDLIPPITQFQLDGTGLNNTTVGIRTGGGDFVLKTYQATDEPAAIGYEHALLAELALLPLPFATPLPVRNRQGATITATAGGWQVLFGHLAGLAANRRDAGQVEAVAAALAQLQLALATLPPVPHPTRSGYAALRQVHPLVPDPAAIDASEFELSAAYASALLSNWQRELATLEQFVRERYAVLPHQIIHGDYACANALWDGQRVSAIIDFEFALPDARAIDLAALIDLVAQPAQGRVAERLVHAACQGYSRHMQLSSAEWQVLPMLIRLRGAVSAIWWAGRQRAIGRKLDAERFEAVLAPKRWLDSNNVQF